MLSDTATVKVRFSHLHVDMIVRTCCNQGRSPPIMRSILALLLTLSATAFAQPVSLFDGKTLDGWDFDPQVWRVEDGLITGGSRTEKIRENYFICTKKSYRNFELKLKIKVSGDPATGMLNSGIQIRSLRVPGGAHMSGYQIDCGKGWFGKIYDEFRRNKVIAEPVDAVALDKAVDVYGWNEYRIRAEGPRIQTWINGVLAIDYTEQDKNVALDGLIGPQVHSGGVCLVQVKDVTVEELPATPDAPTWEKLGGVEAARKLVAPPPKPQAGAAKAAKRDISYNNVQGTALTAEEQLKKFHLPAGYEIELVVKESPGIGKFISVYFDHRGRLWTQTALEYPVDGNENPAAAEAVYAAKGKDKVLVYPREELNAPLPAGGLSQPTVFADGLAIPLGLLPWGNGDKAYVLHGHDILLLTDTNGDGKADKREVVLTGFGVQDSHLFPHQFTRAPGGWVWLAQGLFNNSRVQRPGSTEAVEFPKCSMAQMRPDGSGFEVTSTGPNNIWGLVTTRTGETFIQEANDYGYPVMPFHDYAYYPGGMESLKKSYQPDFPPTAEFRMGGTGLSGLALGEGDFRKIAPALDAPGKAAAAGESATVVFVANPITSRVQTVTMRREGSDWKLEQAVDLVTCDDPFFRPVGMTNGPDGNIYIVDWYNKIISHNEVPRNHPDRDKIRGRIWRVKPKGQPVADTPDMSQMPTENLLDYLESSSPWAQRVAAFELGDRKPVDLVPTLRILVNDENKSNDTRIHALWAWEEIGGVATEPLALMLKDPDRHIRREAARAVTTFSKELSAENVAYFLKPLADDPDADVRRAALNTLCRVANPNDSVLDLILRFARPSLPGPLGQSSRAAKQIPVREAYDREFERFLVRRYLELYPDRAATFLDSAAAEKLPIEARVLAALALEPKTGAARVAKLLPQIQRAPNEEELLRLAQFPTEPGCGEALKALLANPESRTLVADKLLAQKTKLDPAKIAPLLNEAAKALLASKDSERALGVGLIAGFQLTSLEGELVAMVKQKGSGLSALQALRELRSSASDVFAELATSADPMIRDEALAALAASRNPNAAEKLFALYPTLNSGQQRAALNALSSTKAGAKSIVAALASNQIPNVDLDGPTAERLSLVLGNDPELAKLMQSLGHVFHNVLALNGSNDAWVDSNITLDGPFTVECWVRLAPGIGNEDSILGSQGQVDMNFFGSTFRVWVGVKGLHDVVVAKKPITPDLWTHLAVTRDAAGMMKIYQNGELDGVATKPAPMAFTNGKIGWSGPNKGTEGMMTEFRVWNTERSATEIRANFDRALEDKAFSLAKLGKGARIAKTTDYPPLLTEEQAKALDTKFAKYSELSKKPGNLENGKVLSALCIACHTIGSTGGQIGPNLSGAGAMGLEAVLRNILTPNAAMEAGYRIYRVELKSGDIVDAFYVSEDKDAVVVRQPGLQDRRIPKQDVRSTRYIRRSLMPEGLLDALNDQQVTDLMAYLMTLK